VVDELLAVRQHLALKSEGIVHRPEEVELASSKFDAVSSATDERGQAHKVAERRG